MLLRALNGTGLSTARLNWSYCGDVNTTEEIAGETAAVTDGRLALARTDRRKEGREEGRKADVQAGKQGKELDVRCGSREFHLSNLAK